MTFIFTTFTSRQLQRIHLVVLRITLALSGVASATMTSSTYTQRKKRILLIPPCLTSRYDRDDNELSIPASCICNREAWDKSSDVFVGINKLIGDDL